MHISGLFGKSNRNTPLQVVQFSSLSWQYGLGLHTSKNCEQQIFPFPGDSVGSLVTDIVGTGVANLVGIFVGVTFGLLVGFSVEQASHATLHTSLAGPKLPYELVSFVQI